MKKIIYYSMFFFGSLLMVAFSMGTNAQERYASFDLCGLSYFNDTLQPTPGSHEKCRKCLYPGTSGLESIRIVQPANQPPTPYPNRAYTMLGCLSTESGEFTVQISQFFFSIIGGISFLSLLYGASTIAISRANPEKLSQGKRTVYAALAGLLFVLFSTFVIRFIAADILKIPGFGG